MKRREMEDEKEQMIKFAEEVHNLVLEYEYKLRLIEDKYGIYIHNPPLGTSICKIERKGQIIEIPWVNLLNLLVRHLSQELENLKRSIHEHFKSEEHI